MAKEQIARHKYTDLSTLGAWIIGMGFWRVYSPVFSQPYGVLSITSDSDRHVMQKYVLMHMFVLIRSEKDQKLETET